jgi:hypothetical protein
MGRIAAVLVAVGWLGAGAASAQQSTPSLGSFGELMAMCADDAGQESVQFCRGYITGAGQLYQQLVRGGEISPWVCADPVPTLDEARAAIVNWAGANPASAAERPIDGLWRAAAAIWPCPNPGE